MSTKKYAHVQSYSEYRKNAKKYEEDEYDGSYGRVNGTKVKFDIFGKEYGRIGGTTTLKAKSTGFKKVLGDIPEDIPLGATRKELKEWEKTDPKRFKTVDGVQPSIINKGGVGKMGTGLGLRLPNQKGGGLSAKINARLTEAVNSKPKGIGAFSKKTSSGVNIKGRGLAGGLNTAGRYQETEEVSVNKYLEIDENGNYAVKKPKPRTVSMGQDEVNLEYRSIEEVWAFKLLEEVSDEDFDRKLSEAQKGKFRELTKHFCTRNTNGIREIFEWFANEFKDYKRALPQNATYLYAVIGKYGESVIISTDDAKEIPPELNNKLMSLKNIVNSVNSESSIATMIPDSALKVIDKIFECHKSGSLEDIGKAASRAENVIIKAEAPLLSGALDIIRGIREFTENNNRRSRRGTVGGMKVSTVGASGGKWDNYRVGSRRSTASDFGLDAGVGLAARASKLGLGIGGTRRSIDDRDDRYYVPKSNLSARGRRSPGSDFLVKPTGILPSRDDRDLDRDDPFGAAAYSIR